MIRQNQVWLRAVVWPALIALTLLAFGCTQKEADTSAAEGASASGSSTERAAAPEQRGFIGISVLSMNNPFFKVIADSLAEEAAKHGYKVQAVSGDFDVAKQQNQIKDFIVGKASAIVLCPCDSKSIGPAIKEANDAGIPVFTADIACLAPGVEVISHIATDNLQGGRLAAQAMIEALNGRGKVAILDHPLIESVQLRTQGFEEVINRENESPGIDIQIVGKWPGGGDKEPSLKSAQDILQAHPDLDGIFAINDPSALGAIAALENANKLSQVKIIAFDGQPEGKQAIKDGKIFADPVQFPDRIGRQTFEAILAYFNGEDVPKEILIPTELYYQEDALNDPELQ